MSSSSNIVWHLVLQNKDQLQENRVMTVVAGRKQICLSRYNGEICALDNHCPHQGVPLERAVSKMEYYGVHSTGGIIIHVQD